MQTIPIQTLHLFEKLDDLLHELLTTLSPEDWNKPTLAKLWTVKDVAAHLLDGNLRAIAIYRDNYFGEKPPVISSYHDLVTYLNELNATWVKAAKRLSPQILIEQLAFTGKQYIDELKKLAPFEEAIFSVAWAGEDTSANWFHIAREYTEKFHHQMQIREAVNKPGLLTKELFYPFIDTFMCGLPHTYRNIIAPDRTTIEIIILTGVGGSWFLKREGEKWNLSKTEKSKPTTTVIIEPDIAWKLFTKGTTKEEAREAITITGNIELGEVALTMIAIMG